MTVPGVILGLLLSWSAQTQQPYYGTRVTGLSLSGSESQTDLQAIPINIGDILTPDDLRASIKALYDTGRYSYVEADATPAPDGSTLLTFRVRPVYFFSTFRVEPENVLERSLSNYFRLPFGERFTTSAVDRVVEDTKAELVAEGYFQAMVTPRYDTNDETHLITVTLQVDPGPKARIGNVRMQGGDQTFTEEELADAFDLKTGDDFASIELEKGVADVRKKFTELRFLNTVVSTEQMFNPTMNTVDITVTIQPGQFALVQTREFDISDKKLRELVPIYEEAAVDSDLVEEGRVRITRYMQQEAYFDAQVTAEVIEVEPALGNAIQVNYVIVAGAKHKVDDVQFVGNRYFTIEEIRRRTKTRKSSMFSHGVFSADLLEEDRLTIEAMYRNAGYENTLVTARPEDIDHAITVIFQIDEGMQLKVDSVNFKGNTVPSTELTGAISLKPNEAYTPAAVDQARAALTQLYYSRGYADARVERTVERAGDGVRVTFTITEGEIYRIGMILVAGNERTQPKVIRRSSGLHEYSLFNPENILEGQQKLYATGLFSRVEIVTLDQGLRGVRNVLIQVEDAKPILITYGVGFQEFEHLRGTFEISHSNLFGQQRSISLRARGSSRERLAGTTFHEPRLFNHELDGFASTFVEHSERPFFSANRIDFSLQVLKRISLQRNFLLTSSWQTVNIGDVRVNPHAVNDPSQVGPCQICQIGRLGTSFIVDRRSDPVNPTSGFFGTTTVQVASTPFGSELNFTSLFNQTAFYFPWRGGTLATSARFGWNHPFGKTALFAPGQTQQLPATERYFAGGSTTLRGFSLDEAHPASMPSLEGGNVMPIGNVEYRVPLKRLPIEGIGAAFFYDTGNVFPNLSDVHLREFTHSAGFGLRYQTPVGPARLDFGFNLRPGVRQDGTPEPRMKVFFTLGNAF